MGPEGFEPPRSLTARQTISGIGLNTPEAIQQTTMTAIPNVEPDIAVSDFMKERKGEVSDSTHRNYKYTLELLVDWCERNDIEYVNSLDGYKLKQFKTWRQDHDIGKVTLRNNLSTIRVFIKWCEDAELLPPNLHDRIAMPNLSEDEQADDTMLSTERVEHTLAYLEKYEYATIRHVLFKLIWHTGFRMGTVRAIDMEDYHSKRQFVEVRHRPETDTPLKNGGKAERQVNLSEDMCNVIDDYLSVNREPTPDARRQALFTTSGGRVTTNRIRKHMYIVTRPCHVTGECPHDKEMSHDKSGCDAYKARFAHGCPSSMSAHPIRRASLTHHIEQDWPKEKISERGNVSVEVLNKHYDESREEQNRMNRKKYLDNL